MEFMSILSRVDWTVMSLECLHIEVFKDTQLTE